VITISIESVNCVHCQRLFDGFRFANLKNRIGFGKPKGVAHLFAWI
jgi:hypothetical protein